MMKNVIVYFSIITESNVLIFEDESTSIQFYKQWHSLKANTMNNTEI